MFWYEDVFSNPEIEVTNQDHLILGDDKAVFTKVDDLTFTVSFKNSNGLFLLLLAWADSDQTTRFPKHYLSQFLTLEPGDLINTGTPPGVGMGLDPLVYLHGGETLTLGISKLGEQRQRVIG